MNRTLLPPNTNAFQSAETIGEQANSYSILFGALAASSCCVYILGNILLLSPSAAWSSLRILAASLIFICILYSLQRLTGSLLAALVYLYATLTLPILLKAEWLYIFIYATATYALIIMLRDLRIWQQKLLGSSAWLMGSSSALCIFSARFYTSFDIVQRAGSGNIHQDTLFHASIASMLKNYGTTSTGIHGLVPVSYHTFSHALFASISKISGLSVIEVYGTLSQVFFAPFLIFGLSYAAISLYPSKSISPFFSWLTTALMLIIFPIFLKPWAFFDSFLTSESYLVSLGLLAVAMPALYSIQPSGLNLILIPAAAYMIATAKASTGIIFGLIFTIHCFYNTKKSFTLGLVCLILTISLIILGIKGPVDSNIDSFPVHYFSFIKNYSFLGTYLDRSIMSLRQHTLLFIFECLFAITALSSFIILHFFPAWIVIWSEVKRFPRQNWYVLSVPSAFILSSVAIGLIVTLLFKIPGGSAYYFSNVAFFISLPHLILLLRDYSLLFSRSKLPVIPFTACIAILLSLPGIFNASFLSKIHRHDLPQSPLVLALQQLRDKTATSIVISPDIRILKTNPVSRCTAMPFLYPAISERAWANVAPSLPGCYYKDYGYSDYGITRQGQGPSIDPFIPTGASIVTWNPFGD